MIAVTGASGYLGKATIGFLLEKIGPGKIVAVIRDPARTSDFHFHGIQVRVAEYGRQDALRVAFQGITTLIQISATAIGEEGIRQERNVVSAAREMEIEHIIYTGTLTPHKHAFFKATRQSLETEKAILGSGMKYTVFRNSLYMETIPQFIGDALQHGLICYPAGLGKVSFVSRVDIAEALSIVVAESRRHQNKCYEITGSDAFSFADVALKLSAVKGTTVSYYDIDVAMLMRELENIHMPADQVEWVLSLASSIKAGAFAHVDPALETLLGRKPLSLPDFFSADVNLLWPVQ